MHIRVLNVRYMYLISISCLRKQPLRPLLTFNSHLMNKLGLKVRYIHLIYDYCLRMQCLGPSLSIRSTFNRKFRRKRIIQSKLTWGIKLKIIFYYFSKDNSSVTRGISKREWQLSKFTKLSCFHPLSFIL